MEYFKLLYITYICIIINTLIEIQIKCVKKIFKFKQFFLILIITKIFSCFQFLNYLHKKIFQMYWVIFDFTKKELEDSPLSEKTSMSVLK